MKKTYFPILLMVCLVAFQELSCQNKSSQITQSNSSVSYKFLDVKVTNFLFKKVDSNNNIVPFTDKDVTFLKDYFLQKEGVLSVNANSTDKVIEVISLLQKDGKILFQHRQVIELLQNMGYITTHMHCERQQRHLHSNTPQHNQTVTL